MPQCFVCSLIPKVSEKKWATGQSFIQKEITTYRIGTLGVMYIHFVKILVPNNFWTNIFETDHCGCRVRHAWPTNSDNRRHSISSEESLSDCEELGANHDNYHRESALQSPFR